MFLSAKPSTETKSEESRQNRGKFVMNAVHECWITLLVTCEENS